jgi:hypothetical protein
MSPALAIGGPTEIEDISIIEWRSEIRMVAGHLPSTWERHQAK